MSSHLLFTLREHRSYFISNFRFPWRSLTDPVTAAWANHYGHYTHSLLAQSQCCWVTVCGSLYAPWYNYIKFLSIILQFPFFYIFLLLCIYSFLESHINKFDFFILYIFSPLICYRNCHEWASWFLATVFIFLCSHLSACV